MLIEKEIIAPGSYFYTDQGTGAPRKLDVTPELTHYWHEQGTKMLSAGLTIPVPYEHDFTAHPMTPKDKLLNNAGEVKEYKLKGDTLFGVVDVQDPDVKHKIGKSIRWTSPWINSFTDGNGKQWNNVISHLALTTRPRIVKQAPFESMAAALSIATQTHVGNATATSEGFCLSRAGLLGSGVPLYPMAFSIFSGIPFGFPPKAGTKKPDKPRPDAKKPPDKAPPGKEPPGDTPDGLEDAQGDMDTPGGEDGDDTENDPNQPPMTGGVGEIQIEELLCDLLQALGVPMPDETNEQEFKRHLYEAVMSKIKELTSEGMGQAKKDKFEPDQNKPPNQQPNAAQPKANPIIQQEQQPMYMSLDDINKLDDPLKSVALSMYNQTVKAEAKAAEYEKTLNSLRDVKLKEESVKRANRISLLGKLSPRVKADLDAMAALPTMALSMGEGGTVIDPMAQTLAVLEKGLSDLPRLLTTDVTALSLQAHPTDDDSLTDEQTDKLSDDMARMMGCPPEKKAS